MNVTAPDAKSHAQRVKEQINQYRNVENMHAQLADVFRYWQMTYFRPRFTEVCQVNNHLEFYWKPFLKRVQQTGCPNLVSFGCGDGAVEVDVAKGLKRDGLDDFSFHLVELSPMQIERAEKKIAEAGLTGNFRLIQADFNSWEPDCDYAGAMAHHALHHVQDLEHLFDAIKQGLLQDGVFCTIDVVGRNGHMRWPEALELIERMWRFLPEEKRYHHILKRHDREYVNHDCSTQGFEGIRAQDILPLLVERYPFEVFFGFGNLIDVFTSRGFGANFDVSVDTDKAFIDFVQYLNDLLIDLGHLKPTRICAVMSPGATGEPRVYKNWTPEFCVRPTG